jgi:glycosyltransferase involved in cell wall biosynthesis
VPTAAPLRVLITVSGVIESDLAERVERGERPRVDYLELARGMDADLLDVAEARRRSGLVGRLIERVTGRTALLAWACFRAQRRYGVILTDGEQVGLPFALLSHLTRRRTCAHVMIGHILSVRKKALPFRVLRLGRNIDTILVYSSWQQRFVVERLGVAADRVVLTPFMVDTKFFVPESPSSADEAMICSAGLELRDYDTLTEAVRGIDARVVLAAASPWSKRPDPTQGRSLPANVEVCRLDLFALRRLYGDARFVVVPLFDTPFQAGVTTILEAMAMGKAVVCSRTKGQTDVVVDGVNGVYVEPGDVDGLRAAIVDLLSDQARAEALGRAARAYAVEQADIDVYVDRITSVVRTTQDRRSTSRR